MIDRRAFLRRIYMGILGSALECRIVLGPVHLFLGGIWRGAKALFAGGSITGSNSDEMYAIDCLSIASGGIAQTFGQLTQARKGPAAASSGSRLVIAGGWWFGAQGTMDYITVATQGNAAAFGNLSVARYNYGNSAASDGAYGHWIAGATGYPVFPNPPLTATCERANLASTGSATGFAELAGKTCSGGAVSDGSRIVHGGGFAEPGWAMATLQTFSAACGGMASAWGALSVARRSVAACDSAAGRGFFVGSHTGARGFTDVSTLVDWITISSGGTAVDWGNVSGWTFNYSAAGNGVDAVIGGKMDVPGGLAQVDRISMTAMGDATDFGDLTIGRYGTAAASGT